MLPCRFRKERIPETFRSIICSTLEQAILNSSTVALLLRCRNQRMSQGLYLWVCLINRVGYIHVLTPPFSAGGMDGEKSSIKLME